MNLLQENTDFVQVQKELRILVRSAKNECTNHYPSGSYLDHYALADMLVECGLRVHFELVHQTGVYKTYKFNVSNGICSYEFMC